MPMLKDPLSGLPHIERALFIAPHPDDEALGCGGTILRLNAAGAASSVVFLTDGERLYGNPSGEVAEIRRREGLKSSELLGCRAPVFLGFPDGGLARCMKEVGERLSGIVAAMKPDIVFAPSPIDYHLDHIAASRIALQLLRDLGSFKLAFYEVYSTMRFTHLVEITDFVETKKEAILTYRTSLYEKPELYVKAALGLNSHRAVFLQKEGYYEALHVAETGITLGSLLDYLCYKDV